MRVLVATVPLTGHVHPMLLVVRALVERGHEVIWYGARKFATQIEATGARYAPTQAAPDLDDARLDEQLPGLRGTRGLARVRALLCELFIGAMGAQLRDLEALAASHAPDLILADQAHLGAALLAETRKLAWAGLGISALVIPSVDTAPFGAARPPAKNDLDRAVYRFVTWVINRIVFRSVNRAFRAGRVAVGLPAGDTTYFDVLAPDLFLQPTVPGFEYPRRDLPAQVRFIGPLVPRAPVESELPGWWGELETARATGRPVVLVTQGTLATAPRELVVPALRGLANEDVLVVATTGASPAELGIELGAERGIELPANARVAAYVPYEAVLPYVRVMVTNGGYGGVQMALGHGVPMVVAGGSEEKPEIAARVAWSGTGIDLRTGRPRPRAIRRAVRRVLADPTFAARSKQLADECARYDAPTAAVDALEAVVARHAGAPPREAA